MQNLQDLHVKDAYRLNDEVPIVVRLEDEIDHVIENFAHHSELSGIFVVEEEGRFAGVITRTDLLDWTRVKVGAALMSPLQDRSKALRLISLIHASIVSDILRQGTKQAVVTPDDTLARALRRMIEADLVILPVIDEEQHIIGSLTLSELLSRVLGENQA
jgi:CBS-domain-containing membrane protein